MFPFDCLCEWLVLLALLCQLTSGDESIISKDNSSSELDTLLTSPNWTKNSNGNWCDNELCPDKNYGPHSPYVPCDHLPMDFIECDELIDHQGNETSYHQSGGLGCLQFQGGQRGKHTLLLDNH